MSLIRLDVSYIAINASVKLKQIICYDKLASQSNREIIRSIQSIGQAKDVCCLLKNILVSLHELKQVKANFNDNLQITGWLMKGYKYRTEVKCIAVVTSEF